MVTRRRTLVRLIVAAATVLTGVAACGRQVAELPDAVPVATPVDQTPHVVYYVRPAVVPTNDGTLYAHRLGTPASSDVAIAEGTDLQFVPAAGGNAAPHLQWHTALHDSTSFAQLDDAGAVVSVNVLAGAAPLTSLDLAGVTYTQVDDQVVTLSNGRAIGHYPLPTLTPDPTAGHLPAGYKGVSTGAGPGQVSALVQTSNGDVLALRSTGLAAAITDLTTGASAPLTGYGTLGGAVVTDDGDLAVVAWSPYQSGSAIHLLTVDHRTLRVTADVSTGVSPSNYLRDRLIRTTDHRTVLSVARRVEKTGVSLTVWSAVDGAPAIGLELPVAGLDIAAAGGGGAYLFGGPARNVVSLLDLTTGHVTNDITELRAPSGTYVIGIA